MLSIGEGLDAQVETEVWLNYELWNTLPAMHSVLVGCGGCLEEAPEVRQQLGYCFVFITVPSLGEYCTCPQTKNLCIPHPATPV